MDEPDASLWRRSPKWRLLVIAAFVCLCLAWLGSPWRPPAEAKAPGTHADFNAPPAATAATGSRDSVTTSPPPAFPQNVLTSSNSTPSPVAPSSMSSASTFEMPKDALMGKTFSDVVTVQREPIPLPDGAWSTLAHFRGQPGSNQGDAVVLGRFKGKQLDGLIAINAYRYDDGRATGFPAFKGCSRDDYVAHHSELNEPGGAQRCWWVNHAVALWSEQPVFRASAGVLAQRGVTPPQLMINVAFRRATPQGFATAFYYFDPATAQINSAQTSWVDSEWHRSRIAADPARVRYVQQMERWGESWAPIFFAAK